MNTTSLARVVDTALPALSGSGVTYNAKNNIFLTEGYTSAAGNTYFQGIRLSNRIIIKYDIGEGYLHTFLNGVEVYGFNGREKRLIGSRAFNCCYYSEDNAKYQAARIVMEYMQGQVKMLNAAVDDKLLKDFSEQLVAETYKQTKLLA